MGKKNDGQKKRIAVNEWIKILLIVCVAAWGAYEFIYKERILPSKRPTALNISGDLQVAGMSNDSLFINVTLIAKNPTDRRVYIPAYWYRVEAYNVSAKEGELSVHYDFDYDSILDILAGSSEQVCKYATIPHMEVVAQQRIVCELGAYWDPGEITYNDILFIIPNAKYDYLKLYALCAHSRDVSGMNDPIWISNREKWTPIISFDSGDATIAVSESSYIHLSEETNSTVFYDGEPLDLTNQAHAEWQEETATGFTWFEKTLSLWPQPTIR